MQSEILRRLNSIPPMVGIVITQAMRRRAEGSISTEVFDQQIRRITREELDSKGLTMLVRTLARGRVRFIIKEKTSGHVCDMIDFAVDGTPEMDPTLAPPAISRPMSVPKQSA